MAIIAFEADRPYDEPNEYKKECKDCKQEFFIICRSFGAIFGGKISYCPFCGKEIEDA